MRWIPDLGKTPPLVIRGPARHLLLLDDLVLDLGLLVELVEGVDDDGDGQGDDENTTDGTGGSTELSKPGPAQFTDVRCEQGIQYIPQS